MKYVDNEYVAFGALLLITASGLGVTVIGAILLSWAGYLSAWMPQNVWISLTVFIFLGVGIASSSAVAAIATVAPRPKAAHKMLAIMLFFLGLEILGCATTMITKRQWTAELYGELEEQMLDSIRVYERNSSSGAMWNEIQHEISCCGINSYRDWFDIKFRDGETVPDACCLLPSSGCGVDVKNLDDLDDVINTRGCLPELTKEMMRTYDVLYAQAVLPICVMQILMVGVIVLSQRREMRHRQTVATISATSDRLRASPRYTQLY